MESKVSNSSSQLLKAKREFCRKVYQIDPSDRNRVKRNLFSEKSETCELARTAKEVDLKLSQMLSEKKKLKKKQLLNQKQLTLMYKEKKRLDQMKLKTNPPALMYKEKKRFDQMKLKTSPPANRKESRSCNAHVSDVTKKYKHYDRPNRMESRSNNANVSDITKKYKHFDRPKVHKNVFKKKERVCHSLQSFGEAFSNEDFGFGNGKRLNVDLDETFTDLVFQSPSSKHCFNKESKKAGHFLRF